MDIDKVKQTCKKNKLIGNEIVFYEQTTSTNDVAKELAQQGAKEGTVVIADYQRQGKGKLGTKWFSQKGDALLFSVIFYPEQKLDTDLIKELTLLGAKAVQDVLKEILPDHNVEIELPNDVLVDKKKISGVLVETQTTGNKLDNAVLGIGLNVNNKKFPQGLEKPPTSVSLIKDGEKVSRTDLYIKLLSRIEK